MATRQTGFAMLASSSVQDVMNLGAEATFPPLRRTCPSSTSSTGSYLPRNPEDRTP
ncbi:MAG: hypothetical protein ACLT2T_06175 [Bilophila wadsworthia]